MLKEVEGQKRKASGIIRWCLAIREKTGQAAIPGQDGGGISLLGWGSE